MNITHTIRLVTSAKAAIDEVRKYEDAIVGAAQTVEKHTNTLSGDRVLKSANEWTAAVAKLGGATNNLATSEQLMAGVAKMSAAEKERVNRILDQAIGKYTALGKEAPAALRELHAALQPIPSLTDQWVAKTKSAGEALSSAGKMMLPVSAAVASFGYIAIRAAMDYEQAMAKVQEMTGQSGVSLDGLGVSFRAVFRTVPDTSQQVAVALAIVNRDLGLTGGALEELTRKFLDYARISGTDVAESTRTVTQLMKALELDSSGVSLVLDQIVFTSQKTGAGIGDLTNALISGGTMFREFGWSTEGAMALLGQFTVVGAKPIEVVQGLRQALVNMAKDGITDTSGELVKWIGRIKDAGTVAEGTALAAKIFGARVAEQLVQEIRGGTFEIAKFEAEIRNAEGALERATKGSETTSEMFARLKNSVSEASIPIGVALLGAVDKLIPQVERMVGWLAKAVDGFSALPGFVQTTALAFGVVLAAAAPVLLMFGSLLSSLATLIPDLASKLPAALTTSAGALSALKVAGGLAAAAFVGWQIGRLIAELTGLDDIIARLAARSPAMDALNAKMAMTAADVQRLVANAEREAQFAIGMDKVRAQARLEAIKADWDYKDVLRVVAQAISKGAAETVTFSEAIEFLRKNTVIVAGAVNTTTDTVEEFDAAAEQAAAQASALAKAFQSNVDMLTGKALARDVAELAAQVRAAGTQGGVSAYQMGLLGKKLMDLAKQGAVLPPELAKIEAEFARLNVKALPVVTTLESVRAVLGKVQGVAMSLPPKIQLPRIDMSNIAFATNELAEAFLAWQGTVRIAGGKTGSAFSAAFADSVSGLGAIVVGAIQGGGDIGGSIGAKVGGDIGASLAKNILGESTSALAKGALSFLGPLGALAGQAVGKFIGGLFGKSAGRKELEEFNGKIDDLRGNLLKTYGSFEQIAALDKALGTDVSAGWAHQGKKGFEAWSKSVEELQARLEAVKAEMADVGKSGGLASAQLIAYRDAMFNDTDVQAFVLGQVQAAAGHVKTYIDNASVMTQEGASAMSSVILAAWDGTAQGLRDLQPTISALQARLEEAGFTGGAAFDGLRSMAAIAGDQVTGPMVTAINAATGALTAMHNAGFLSQEVFTGLTLEVMAQRDALLASGATADQVNAVMQADLQRIWELTQDGTYAIDEKTAALLAEAEAAGQVGDKFRSTEDRMMLALERIANMFETVFADKLTSASQRGASAAESALRGIPTDLDVTIHPHVRSTSGGDDGMAGDVPGFRTGTGGKYLNFGSQGMLVRLHDRERVMTEAEGRAEAQSQAMSTAALEAEIRALRAELPRAVGVAVQDAVLLAPRGRR